MKRQTAMKRTGMKRRPPDTHSKGERARVLPVVEAGAFRLGAPIAPRAPQPKHDFDELPAYRAWVKTHACLECTWPAPSVCCHANEGKGQGLKVSDRRTFALCGRCHEILDQSKGMTREQRRAKERAYVARMQQLARAAGRKEIE